MTATLEACEFYSPAPEFAAPYVEAGTGHAAPRRKQEPGTIARQRARWDGIVGGHHAGGRSQLVPRSPQSSLGTGGDENAVLEGLDQAQEASSSTSSTPFHTGGSHQIGLKVRR
jgi:hypothetical protein